MQMRKYRIYVGAGVLIFVLVLSYFAYHRIRCTKYLQNPKGAEETVSISVMDYFHDTSKINIQETDTFWNLLGQCEYDGIAEKRRKEGMRQPYVAFMINGKADMVMTYKEDGVVRGIMDIDGKKYNLKQCEKLHQYGISLCQ